MRAFTSARAVPRNIHRMFCVIACTLMMSCAHTKINSDVQKEAEKAFSEQRFSDVIGLLSQNTKELSASSKYYLAKSYLSSGQENKLLDSLALLEDSAQSGSPEAAWELARTYDETASIVNNTLLALDWYRYHALMTRNQNTDTQYFDEQGKATSPSQMIDKLTGLAKTGDAAAQVQLAKILGEGINTDIDLPKSFFWYKKAAESGNESAALMLGFYFCRGLGTEKDTTAASRWLVQFNEQLACN